MSTRDLWSAVVLQAANDIDTEHYGSVDYGQAVSFFTSPGEWAESRQQIADCLELHPDDLIRLGRAAIAARHLRDGPEPVIERVAHPVPEPKTRPEPITRCTVAPVVTKPPVVVRPPRAAHLPPLETEASKTRRFKRALLAEKRDKEWWIKQFLAKHAA